MQQPQQSRAFTDYLQLLNPPLALAAAAECLAGAFLGGAAPGDYKPYLVATASAALFAAGSVFGHYFDLPVDQKQHPERPLPAGRIDPGQAWLVGWGLLLPAILMPLLAGRGVLAAAVAVAVSVVLYAAVTKSIWGFGFLTLGAARALNLVLGLSVTEHGVAFSWKAAIPIALYAAGWAVLRSSKQAGAPPSTAFVALLHMAAGLSVLLFLSWSQLGLNAFAFAALVVFGLLVLPRLVRAVLDGRRPAVLEAVQWSFLGLVLLEAAMAGGSNGLPSGLIVAACCLPVYFTLRKWPVTLVMERR